jgi:dimethylhistidine N-methyltransferase
MTAYSQINGQAIDTSAAFRQAVVLGLNEPARSLPAKYFYDERGSQLFDQICDLTEYYPTRSETQIMKRFAASMANQIGSDVRLIEYGSGSSLKTRFLLDHLVDPTSYVPVDISAEHLIRTAENLARDYPLVDVCPVVADFTRPFELPRTAFGTAGQCIYFPGSTIGNFGPDEATSLLASMARTVDDDGGLLIGFDLQKDISVLEAAYNDRQGVTAEFNRNLLRRINLELGADFDRDQFEHLAFYNRSAHRIEMHLVSRREQLVTIDDELFFIGWGETICTEYSYKYTVESFGAMASSVGWSTDQVWSDPNEYFAVMYLTR